MGQFPIGDPMDRMPAMQSQRKKKQRDKEEKKKEAARIAKLREAKKDNDEQVTKNRPQKKQKS